MPPGSSNTTRMSWTQEVDQAILMTYVNSFGMGKDIVGRIVDQMRQDGYECTPKAVSYGADQLSSVYLILFHLSFGVLLCCFHAN
jgi:hypothetical protein